LVRVRGREMSDAIDAIALANAKSKGKRPYFLENSEIENVLNITMALAQEVAVLRERTDTLERLLESKGMFARRELDAFVPNKLQANERAFAHQQFIARILRIIQQENESMSQHAEASATPDELAKN
jgi:hypothetical protein